MNKRRVLNVLGRIILTEALLMIPSLAVSLYYGDGDAGYLAATIFPAALLGILCSRIPTPDARLTSRDGYCIVAYAWIVISLIGAVPLFLTGQFRSYWSALFEVVSGFTTTGASVLAAPERLPHGVLFWRSFTHWVGGMGVLVFVLMIIPMKNDNSMHLIRAEVPGPTAGKLVPRMKRTSAILYGIYAAMTVVSVFMLLFGVNFNVYYLILLGRIKDALKSEEVRCYLGIVAAATIAITLNLFHGLANLGLTLRQAFFQVSSIITTTGFATVDFDLWPEFSKHTLVLLMLVGACAGSTGGGLKVSRVIILVKSFFAEIRYIISPKSIQTVRLEYKTVDKATLNSTRTYAAAYLMLVSLSTLLISLNGYDLTTNLTAVLSCINNIGPGLARVGPTANFSVYNDAAQVLLSVVMLIGRLEIFPIFTIFSRSAHDR